MENSVLNCIRMYFMRTRPERRRTDRCKMSQIILGTEKLKAFRGLSMLCEYAGKSEEWCNELWLSLLTDYELYTELLYYLENHCFADCLKAAGYSLTDLYVWQMGQDNLRRDTGKNTENCNKEEMVLQAFWTMAQMRKDPSEYERKLADGSGMGKE